MTRRRLRWLGLALGLGLLLIGLWRYGGLALDVKQTSDDLAGLRGQLSGRRGLTAAEAGSLADRLASDAARLDAAADLLAGDPLIGLLRRLPGLDRQIDAGQRLTRAGAHSARAGNRLLTAARATGALGEGDRSAQVARALPKLPELAPAVAAAADDLAAARRVRGDLRPDGLVGPLSSALRQLDRDVLPVEPLLRASLPLLPLLPEALGANGPRTYLILNQNDAERFPTGGFIGSYGLLTIDRGQVVKLEFEDVYALYLRWQARSGGAYVEPPAPLREYLLNEYSWALGESGWAPDFPQAARQAEWFLQLEGGPAVDGVIAFDLQALRGLIGALGPLRLEEVDETITAANLVERSLSLTRRESVPGENRKGLVGRLAEVLRAQTLAAPPARWAGALDAVRAAGDQKHLLLAFHAPALQQAVVAAGWDGALATPPAADRLALVDATLSAAKTDLIVDRSTRIEVNLGADGGREARVAVRYRNRFAEWAALREAKAVQFLVEGGDHRTYLRLLAPPDSELLSSPGTPDDVPGWAAWGQVVAVGPNAETEASFRLSGPAGLRWAGPTATYRLALRQQPGISAEPVEVVIQLPPNARLVRASPDPAAVTGQTVRLRLTLDRDRLIELQFQMG